MANDTAIEAGQTVAELRRELALRTAERDEALAQLSATAEVLQVINSSPGDLAPVFDALLEKAIRLCGGAFGNLLTYDGELFSVAASVHADSRVADQQRQRAPFRPVPAGALTAMLGGEEIFFTEDILQISDYRAGHAEFRQMVDSGGYRTVFNVALRKEGALLGTIGIFRVEVQPFTDKQIPLLQNFAAQAVIAMENARLITETREALERQTATAEILQVINSSPTDLQPVFEAIADSAARLCNALNSSVYRFDGELIHFLAQSKFSPQAVGITTRLFPAPPSRDNATVRTVADRAAVHISDVREDPEYRSREWADAIGLRSVLSVPMLREDRPIGVITVNRAEAGPFPQAQIELLKTFADQAVIAIENTRLITETREALEQQTATAEVLQVINSSPGDLAPVFDAMLEKAHKLCGAVDGTLFLYQDGKFRAAAIRNVPETFAERLRQGFNIADNPVAQPLVDGQRFVHIPDLALVDHPVTQAGFKLSGTRTLIAVPLRKSEALLGMIVGARKEVRPFSDKEITLLENFGAQAVIAMENARLLGELRQRTDEIAAINRDLEARVAAQVTELERTGKLRRFLAPQLAELIVAQGDESILETHRREIVVVFCDLRGFTAFAERAEPEEVVGLLREYHGALGPIVARYEGTLDHYSGDGIMVFFNDPMPCPEPARRAVEMAVAMREAAQDLLQRWRRHGHDIGFGVGIAQGYATLGQIGFAERMDYTAIGTVCNLAARLCAEARDGQILVSSRVASAVEDGARLEQVADVSPKGLSQPVLVYNVV